MMVVSGVLTLIRSVSLPTQLVIVVFVISLLKGVVYSARAVLLGFSNLSRSVQDDDASLETLRSHHPRLKVSIKKPQKKRQNNQGTLSKIAETGVDHGSTKLGSGASRDVVPRGHGMSLKSLQKMSSKLDKHDSSQKHDSELYIETLKGHTDAVLGLSWVSSRERHLVTACQDRELRVFSIGYNGNARSTSRCTARYVVRGGLFDVFCCYLKESAKKLYLSFMTHGPHATVEFHMAEVDVSQKRDSSLRLLDAKAKIFAPKIDFEPLCLVGVQRGGSTRCIAASSKPRVAVFDCNPSDIDHEIHSLGSFDTNSIINNDVALSPDGSMFAVATFSPDVGIYRILDSVGKAGQPSVKKISSLVGHKKKVTSVCFSPCGMKMVTASGDYTLRIWNIAVRHDLQESPTCLSTRGLPSQHAITRMSWNGNSIAAACHRDVYIFDSSTGKVQYSILQAHTGKVRCLEYVAWEGMSILASGGEDCCVKIWAHPISK